MVKRYVDEGYFKYTAYNAKQEGLEVVCPDCGARGVVSADEVSAYFRCTKCVLRKQRSMQMHVYSVKGICSRCQRAYRVEIDQESSKYKMLNVHCPYCDMLNQGVVHQSAERYSAILCIDSDGMEPYFDLKLWYQTAYHGNLIWAVNRPHLIYMIDYLSAQLREKCTGAALRSQSDHLLAFIRSSKNRARIVKLLQRLLEQ